MLTPADDYPLHQTPEPFAYAGTDRNFYDRFFYNAQAADGSFFVAVAFGVYPQLDIMDASVSVILGDKQYNLHASKHMQGDRLDLSVGPIRITIDKPIERTTITIAENDGPISGRMTMTARHFPIEEPRFTRRVGTRLLMDVTRMTGNGDWEGALTVDGQSLTLSPQTTQGTRDRSWGIRPVGAADSQPPAGGMLSQFYWLWTPANFDKYAVYFHTNDDEHGRPWNRRGVVVPMDGEPIEFETIETEVRYRPGSRRVESVRLAMSEGDRQAVLKFDMSRHFYMAGLGYTHPTWGHGNDHGALAVENELFDLAELDDNDPRWMHIQGIADATLEFDGATHHGRGAVEQLFVGPHAPSGMADLFDPAGSR